MDVYGQDPTNNFEYGTTLVKEEKDVVSFIPMMATLTRYSYACPLRNHDSNY